MQFPHDLFNLVSLTPGLNPSAGPSDNTPQVSAILDSQGAGAALLVIETGTLVSGVATFDLKIERGNAANLSDAALADISELLPPATNTGGTAITANPMVSFFIFSDDAKTLKVGIKLPSTFRYWRATITPVGNVTSAAPMSMAWATVPSVVPAP